MILFLLEEQKEVSRILNERVMTTAGYRKVTRMKPPDGGNKGQAVGKEV